MSKNILFLALSFLEVSEGTEGTYREWTVEVGRKQLQRLLSELHLTSHHLPRLSLPSFLRPMCLESSQCPLDLLSVLWCPRALQLSSACSDSCRTSHGGPQPCPWVWGPPSSSAQHLQSLPQWCWSSMERWSSSLHLCHSSCGTLTGRSPRRKVPQYINFLRKKENIAQAKRCPSTKLKY